MTNTAFYVGMLSVFKSIFKNNFKSMMWNVPCPVTSEG